jgi:hypothetical protein
MNHGLRSYWNGSCSCILCRSANADYHRERYLARAKGESNLVPITRAKQLLLSFESNKDASRALGINRSTIVRIMHGKVKKIRRSTEQKILDRAA